MAEVSEKERKILVAVDEGEESSYALSWCLNNIVNQNFKDTLILLYAKPPRAVYPALDGAGEEERPHIYMGFLGIISNFILFPV